MNRVGIDGHLMDIDFFQEIIVEKVGDSSTTSKGFRPKASIILVSHTVHQHST
jgi:hypothetical protein